MCCWNIHTSPKLTLESRESWSFAILPINMFVFHNGEIVAPAKNGEQPSGLFSVDGFYVDLTSFNYKHIY